MTNPPSGGSVTQASTVGAAGTASDADFGATTLSGRTATNPAGAPAGTPTDHAADGHTRTDIPAVKGPGAEPPMPTPTPDGAPVGALGAIPGATPAGASGPIRGIRTGRNRGPRRARLQIRHINPVTVLKFSCVLSIALFFVWLIIIGVLFGVLDAAGVIKNINDTVTQLNGAGSKPPVTAGIVFGGAAIIGVVNIALFIALSTIGAVIYNLCADLVGGIEITLSER
jgi:hypothetical protein